MRYLSRSRPKIALSRKVREDDKGTMQDLPGSADEAAQDASASIDAPLRNLVFVSFSHADVSWLKRLRTHLKPFERQGIIEVWDDQQIQTGAHWQEEIGSALARARVAVLLVSPDFLASDFIAEHELPRLLDATPDVTVVWIPVRPSNYTATDIGRYQAALDPKRSLAEMNEAEADRALVLATTMIEQAFRAGNTAVSPDINRRWRPWSGRRKVLSAVMAITTSMAVILAILSWPGPWSRADKAVTPVMTQSPPSTSAPIAPIATKSLPTLSDPTVARGDAGAPTKPTKGKERASRSEPDQAKRTAHQPPCTSANIDACKLLCRKNDPDCLKMAQFLEGRDPEQQKQAADLYEVACGEAHNGLACLRLARSYACGIGRHRNPQEARVILRNHCHEWRDDSLCLQDGAKCFEIP